MVPAKWRSAWPRCSGCRSRRISTGGRDRKSTRLNSSHLGISYAVFCLKKKKKIERRNETKAALDRARADPARAGSRPQTRPGIADVTKRKTTGSDARTLMDVATAKQVG